MKVYLNIVAGLFFASLGWELAQLFLSDLNWFTFFPELIIFPCVSMTLSSGLVFNEVITSNPTRPKACLRKLPLPIALSIVFGIFSGLLGALFTFVLSLPQISDSGLVLRLGSWVLIGSSIGFSEGFTWKYRSVEAGNKSRYRQRFRNSLLGSIFASLFAALVFEFFRSKGVFTGQLVYLEDPIGFCILGASLGAILSLTTSPSYSAALRAGAGFEYTEQTATSPVGLIDTNTLRFVTLENSEIIEEGLSIQLPIKGKVVIGSAESCQIKIPDLDDELASIEVKGSRALLIPNKQKYRKILYNCSTLPSPDTIELKHNDVISLLSREYDDDKHFKKMFRFVFFNRFFDPNS